MHESRLFWFALLVALIFGFTFVGGTYAQEPTPYTPTDNEVNAVAKGLYCPVCENIPLDVCPTQACAQWRALIREKLRLGWSEQQIDDYFVAQYGDRVLAAPPARGLNWLVYLIPPVAIVTGIYILFRAMRAWRQPISARAAIEPLPDAENDEYVARLEEELRQR